MRLEETWRRYTVANREYRRLLMRAPGGRLSDPDSPLARARKLEVEALAAYMDLLGDLAQLRPKADRRMDKGV